MSDVSTQDPKTDARRPGRTGPVAETLPQGAIEALARAQHGDPFAVLGPHKVATGLWEIRAMLPEAASARVVGRDGATIAEMERRHPSGFYVARLPARTRPEYRIAVDAGGQELVREDPYRFGPVHSDEMLNFLRDPTSDAVYRQLGAHKHTHEGVEGFVFGVWAPSARRVSVVGDFNGWDGRRHAMRLRPGHGVWELFIPELAPGERYKYEILGPDGTMLPLKADPVALSTEMRPQTASVLCAREEYTFSDEGWRETRQQGDPRRKPMSVYEVHLGSWARKPEEENAFLTYRDLAERLVSYVKDLGFTHIELLPVNEHPFDGSWGYQPTALFAPTRRFGSPEDFAYFIDKAHEAGIGVLLDWVPGHFPTDAHGLGLFDGTHLYEHADPRQGFHQDWGTYIYNFGRDEVRAFLVSNARFWLERFHIDGLRVDAVASMLYLDYSRKHGEWVPNRYGGNENLEAIDFLRRMNETVYSETPGIMTIAEESTAWPGVSKPVYLGGLGFGFKWNMGWMHDTLSYMQHEPIHRQYHHNLMTFGMVYAYSENYILPLSHDEVVHGKRSILGRMPGDQWQRFANLRAYYGFMWTHPGKKLLFMGGEFGQEKEWNHDQSLDWHLLDDPMHKGVQTLVRDLNRLYQDEPALHARDCEPEGFEWLVGDDSANSVFAYARKDGEGRTAIVVSNFTPVPREGYRIGVPEAGLWREALNTDAAVYGGSNMGNMGGVQAEEVPSHGKAHSVSLALPPLATIVLVRG